MAAMSIMGDDAYIKKRKRPAGDPGAIDFSPLCDMTFQLLAFFIMTVRLANQEMVDVPKISHGKGVEVDSATFFTILAPGEMRREPKLLIGNGREGSEVSLDDARQAIESGVRAGKANIIIKAERTVPAGFVQRLSQIVASVTGAELYIGVADDE